MTQNKETLFKRICVVLLLAIILMWLAGFFIRFSCFINSPAEYRDNAFVEMLNQMIDGNNPYKASSFYNSNEPGVLVDSGFIHLLPALLVCKLFGFSALPVMYILNLFYSLICAALIYGIVKKYNGNTILALLGATLSFSFMLRHGVLMTRPDLFALLCQLIIIFLIGSYGTAKNISIWISALCAVLIILSKPHYVLLAVALVIYMLIAKEYKACIKYVVACGIIAIVVLGMVYLMFPVHTVIWIERLYEMFAGAGGDLTDAVSASYVLDKWWQVGKRYAPFFIIIVSGFVYEIIKNKKINIENTLENILWLDLILNALFLCYTGRHRGAGLWYFYFTLMPAVAILSVIILGKIQSNKKIQYAAIIIAVLWTGYRNFKLMPDVNQVQLWKNSHNAVREVADKYISEDMYLSPLMYNIAEERGIYNFDSGDTVYVPMGESPLYNLMPFLKENIKVRKLYTDYYETVLEKIRHKEYSLITVDSIDVALTGNYRNEFYKALEEYYQCIDTLEYYDETLKADIQIFVPLN